MHTLRAVDAMQSGLYVKKSNISHPIAGNGVFARKTFYAKDTVAAFYGILIYQDLSKEKAKLKQYGKALYGVTAAEFMQKAISVDIPPNLTVSGLDGSEVSVPYVGIYPIPCCVAGTINDPRYLTEDRDRHNITNRRSANVIFMSRKATSKKVEDFAATNCVYLVANRTIHEDEELYVDYGPNFSFDWYHC